VLCREIQLRPEAALLEDLSMEDASGHLPPSVDLPMHRAKSGRCGSGALDKCEASGDVPFVVLHPENAVKQLRCLEERLRQVCWMPCASFYVSVARANRSPVVPSTELCPPAL
jgi:hypothetical protein